MTRKILPDNPFKPFHAPTVRALAHRDEIVETILGHFDKDALKCAIVYGPIGSGKSTIANLLVPRAVAGQYQVCRVSCTPGMTCDMLISKIARVLGITRTSIMQDFDLSARTGQSIGSVDHSSNVSAIQVSAYAQADESKPVSAEYYLDVLHAFSQKVGTKLLVILDQVEQLYSVDHRGANLLLEAVVRSTAEAGVAALIAVRQEHLISVLDLALPHPSLTQSLVPVKGFGAFEAKTLLEQGFESAGVKVSKALVERVIEALEQGSSELWPLGLQAVGHMLVEKARLKGARLSAKTTLMPDMSGAALSGAIENALKQLPSDLQVEALFVLQRISSLNRHSKAPSIVELQESLGTYSQSDLKRMIKHLSAFRLVDFDDGLDHVWVAHETVGTAVELLTKSASSALDEILTAWMSGSYPDIDRSLRDIRSWPSEKDLPVAAVGLLADLIFNSRDSPSPDLRQMLSAQCQRKEPSAILKFLAVRRKKRQSATYSIPELFLLFFDDRPETLRAALQTLADRNFTSGATHLSRALHLASPRGLPEALEILMAGKGSFPESTLRALVSYLVGTGIPCSLPLAEKLYVSSKALARADTLLLVLGADPGRARELAQVALSSGDEIVRATAFEILSVNDNGGNHFTEAMRDQSAHVRRRIVASTDQKSYKTRREYFADASNDPSPFVREAVMEVIGTFGSDNDESVVQRGLMDTVDFVRESALYALKRVVTPLEAAFFAEPHTRDLSGAVREAAYRVIASSQISQSLVIPVRDILAAAPPLSTGALHSVRYSESPDLDETLLEILKDKYASGSLLLNAIEMVGLRRVERAAPILALLLDTHDLDLISSSIVALQRIGGTDSVGALLRTLNHPSADIRERLLYVLPELEADNIADAIRPLLWDAVPSIRARAILALVRLGDTSALEQVKSIPSSTEEIERAKQKYFDRVLNRRG